uniref:MOSC domain-containing protein n=2 Tax=Trichogramma kaykai TaxID=54128 RepID=A0ABD2W3T8_9HYME
MINTTAKVRRRESQLTTFIITTGTITALSFVLLRKSKRKEEDDEKGMVEKILSSSDESWKRVGKVKDLLFYPLKSGRAQSVTQCLFGEYGISVEEAGNFCLKDRMFLVYNHKTGEFKTGRDYPKLLTVKLLAVNEKRAKLEVSGISSIEFDLPMATDDTVKIVNCSMWWGEPVKCIDCGSAASSWLSKFLLGCDEGLSLGLCTSNGDRRNVTGGSVWERHAQIYKTMRNEDTGLFSDLASYMLMSVSSVDNLNERLIKPIPVSQLRPNIVVDGCPPFAEDEWEWIKVGNGVILRNIKPCTRCTMVRVDPETGIPDPEYEPLKTLRTYRKLKNSAMDVLEKHAPAIGIYCGAYQTGSACIGDDVYAYTK